MSDLLLVICIIAGVATGVYSAYLIFETRRKYYQDYLNRKRGK
jgi:hypothetical protein